MKEVLAFGWNQQFIPMKSGNIWLCVNYRELKNIPKDAYPLPLLDEVQDSLLGSVLLPNIGFIELVVVATSKFK